MRVAWRPTFVLLLASTSCATSPRATPAPPAAAAQPAQAPAATPEPPATAPEPPAARRPLTPQMVADYVRAQSPMVKA
jgi:hypothetical protein